MTHVELGNFQTRILELRCRSAGDRAIIAGLHLLQMLERRANFNPAQPRDEQGRWTGTGRSATDRTGGSDVAATGADRTRLAGSADRGLVELREEEGRDGGHTIAEHVGKSDDELLARVGGDAWYGYALVSVR